MTTNSEKRDRLPFARPTLGDDEAAAVREVLECGWITTGPRVQAFETALAEYLDGGVSVRVFNSGTSALEASLLALDIGPGDEVIVPAMSFVASANVVLRAGAVPRFVDVDLGSRNIRPESLEAALGPRTRAVLPVHFAGFPVDLEPIYVFAERHRLAVVEDAAQAIGTLYQGRKIGASGNPVCFSFHPNKNITTIEGGAVACKDPVLLKRLERIRFHGIERDEAGETDVPEWGGKMNMPDVGAALGLVQLRKLDTFTRARRGLANLYLERLPKHPALALPRDIRGHSWHMFCVLVDFDSLGITRRQFQQRLERHGVVSGIHYPAIHLFTLYRRLGYRRGDFPAAERIGAGTLTLPLFPTLRETDVERVCGAVADALNA